VNFSSGVVHGVSNGAPVDNPSEFTINLNGISVNDSYRVAKLNSETKHRCVKEYSIIDLRLFSFYSRYIELSSGYLVTDMVIAIRDGLEFVTDKSEITRDFVHPDDLRELVNLCGSAKGIDRTFDVYSKQAVKKSEIIRSFEGVFGLRTKYVDETSGLSPTGAKAFYSSENRDAGDVLGYVPQKSSRDALIGEGEILLAMGSGR
jgi:nucleoside-diphosphate-sugar epimerase